MSYVTHSWQTTWQQFTRSVNTVTERTHEEREITYSTYGFGMRRCTNGHKYSVGGLPLPPLQVSIQYMCTCPGWYWPLIKWEIMPCMQNVWNIPSPVPSALQNGSLLSISNLSVIFVITYVLVLVSRVPVANAASCNEKPSLARCTGKPCGQRLRGFRICRRPIWKCTLLKLSCS